MNSTTWNRIRTAYYIGIAVLVLYIMPASSDLIAKPLNFQPIAGISLINMIATLVGLGAFMAFKRKYI